MKQMNYLKESLNDFRTLCRDHADDDEVIYLMFDRRNGNFWVDEFLNSNSWSEYDDEVIYVPVQNYYRWDPDAIPCNIKSVTRYVKSKFPEYSGKTH